MAEIIELKYDAAPAFGPIYRALIFGKRKGFRTGDTWPTLRSVWRGAKANLEKLNAYRGLTGWASNGKLPLLYPHIISSPLHLGMMAHPAFPLSPLGGVHARNVIVQHRPIGEDEALDFTCTLGEARVIKQGLEFDVISKVEIGGELVWESSSTYLFRGKFGAALEGYEAPRLADLAGDTRAAGWKVPGDMGRRYAKACGDYNPIHISKILAKVFGFKRDLIHGMWSAAKALVEAGAPAAAASGAVRFDVIFKGPIWIGSKAEMKLQDGDGQRFDVFCSGNDRPCINGLFKPVQPGAGL